MKKEQPLTNEQQSLASRVVKVPFPVKQKENIIVFKKKNSGKLVRNQREPVSDDEIEHNRLNGSLKPKPQLPSEESISLPSTQNKQPTKGLPVLALAGNNPGKKLMIHKALMEYAKNLPVANPHQEKESLQHETFQLKQKNNELASENIKLKTKLMTLEKENIRLQRVLDEQKIYPPKEISTAASNGRQTNAVKGQQQSLHSVKALLRDCRKELEEVREENMKIKKSVKYTRINELQQQKKAYSEQTIRLRQLLQEQFSQNIQHKLKQHDLTSMEQRYHQQQQTLNSLRKEHSEMANKARKAEEKLKAYVRFGETEKNLNRIIAGLKKNLRDREIELENTRKDLKQSRETKDLADRSEQKVKHPPASTGHIKHGRSEHRQISSIPTSHHQTKCQNCAKSKAECNQLQETVKKLQEQLKKKEQQIESWNNKQASLKSTVKKPTPQILKEVSDFLVYRFKAHHLPLQATENYLFKKQQNGTTQGVTSVGTMIEILLTQPFFITNSQYLQSLVVYLFYNDKTEEEFEIDEKLQKPNSQLFAVFKKLIGEYVIIEPRNEQEMFIQIAQLVTGYCPHISAAFDSKRNGEGTISRTELVNFLTQIELQKQYIEFIITQVILESVDLEHLNYFALFQIFYLPVPEEGEEQKRQKPRMLGIEGEVKQLDEQYEDSQSHNNDADDRRRGQPANKSSFKNKDKSQSMSKKDPHEKVDEEDYYGQFDEEQPPVEKKDRSRTKPDKEKSVRQEHVGEQLEEDEEYAPDYEA